MKRIKKLLPVLMLPIFLGVGACATAHKNPCNPCGQKMSQPCNPCSKKNPCNPCSQKNPCNPCSGKAKKSPR